MTDTVTRNLVIIRGSLHVAFSRLYVTTGKFIMIIILVQEGMISVRPSRGESLSCLIWLLIQFFTQQVMNQYAADILLSMGGWVSAVHVR